MLVTLGTLSAVAAILVGVALGVILYFVLTRLFCSDEAASQPAAAPARAETPAPAAKPEPAAAPKATAEPKATTGAKAAAAPAVKSGTQLPGQEELASRKGEWKYQGGAAAATPTPTPTPAPATPVAAGGEGQRPQGLTQARDGKPDDLKQIKGVGPKLEHLLNSMGYFHFDQIAAWTGEEVAWVDQNLKGFKGRVSRDGWVEQAKTLAAGGQTEFSKRVEDGDVY
ncbi:endonuclease [Roseovarius amoyensis]|uniref:endonuclease n=1 Tax=Roseovarius amoyensis TaxID=2211448 RepID=UPI001EF7FAE5|nr:endonuclease [Roseovarius amoyensis]